MASLTREKDIKLFKTLGGELYQQWQESAAKIRFGEHELTIEWNEIDELFIQKAKEELREMPEIIAESCAELEKLIAGRTRSIIKKKHLELYYHNFNLITEIETSFPIQRIVKSYLFNIFGNAVSLNLPLSLFSFFNQFLYVAEEESECCLKKKVN